MRVRGDADRQTDELGSVTCIQYALAEAAADAETQPVGRTTTGSALG
jgi:hypothetical protein